MSTLFGDKDTLMIYSMMYGPQRQAPCPMCTSFLSSWNGTAVNLRERVAIAVTARSPIDRLIEYKKQRGFANLPFVSDMSGEYTRTYVNPEDADVPGFSVFSRRDGIIRHFYTGEMSGAMADPGQDPRGGPDLDPLWLMLDLTPGGRGTDWYPKLDYGDKGRIDETRPDSTRRSKPTADQVCRESNGHCAVTVGRHKRVPRPTQRPALREGYSKKCAIFLPPSSV